MCSLILGKTLPQGHKSRYNWKLLLCVTLTSLFCGSQELFDDFVKEWKPRFAVGQLLDGLILSTDKAKGQIEMTLRTTNKVKRAQKESEASIPLEEMQEGQVVKGVIKRIETYGVFIRVQGSGISGLCHKSEVGDVEKAAASPT